MITLTSYTHTQISFRITHIQIHIFDIRYELQQLQLHTKNVHTHTKIKRVAVQNHLAMHTSIYKYIYIVCSLYVYINNRYSYISYIYISKICSANLKLAKNGIRLAHIIT